MKTTRTIKTALWTITTLSLLTIIPTAAHANDSEPTASLGKCPYSLLLQKSVEAQRAYLVKIERAQASNPIAAPEGLAGTTVDHPAGVSVAWDTFSWGSGDVGGAGDVH